MGTAISDIPSAQDKRSECVIEGSVTNYAHWRSRVRLLPDSWVVADRQAEHAGKSFGKGHTRRGGTALLLGTGRD